MSKGQRIAAGLLVAGTSMAITALGCDSAPEKPPKPDTGHTKIAKTAAATASSEPSASASAAKPSAPVASTPPAGASASAVPSQQPIPELKLLDENGKPLGQTKAEPSTESPLFQKHLKQLWQAIVHDDPERAFGFFFPVEAYAQVKGIKKPERDHKFRLLKAFKRDVHAYHRRLGKEPQKAQLLRLELRNKAQWMKPGSEGNRIGYFRVTRSYLHYRNAAGKKRRLDLTSMISWRGEWFVVHLHGFR